VNENEHTPGPWKIGTNGKTAATFRIWRNDGPDSGNAGYAVIAPHVHGAANSRLVQVAPEMKDLLKRAVFAEAQDAASAAKLIRWIEGRQ
jgi:hypothetical protein